MYCKNLPRQAHLLKQGQRLLEAVTRPEHTPSSSLGEGQLSLCDLGEGQFGEQILPTGQLLCPAQASLGLRPVCLGSEEFPENPVNQPIEE